MLFFGTLRNAIWTLFTTLSHDFTLWKWVIKRYILEVNVGSTSRVLFESAKIRQESPQTRKEIEKGSKNGSLPRWQNRGKGVERGWTNVSRGHFVTLRWSDVLSECNFTHVISFLRSIMIYRSLCTSAPDVKQKKTREFLPVSHGYGLILRCPRNGSQCFTSGCKPQFSAGGPFL